MSGGNDPSSRQIGQRKDLAMQITGKLDKYRPFTSMELRTTALENVMCWLFVMIAGYGSSGAFAGFMLRAPEIWARYLVLGAIGTAGAVAFFWQRDESTGGFIRSWRRRNRLRYAVIFSKSADNPVIVCGIPFLLREWENCLECLRRRQDNRLHILIPLDGSVGTALAVMPGKAENGHNPRLHEERVSEWKFGGVDLHDLPDMSLIRIRDPNGGESKMLLNDAFDFIRDAPFGAAAIGDGQCTFAGFHRYYVEALSSQRAGLVTANQALDKARKDLDEAVRIATGALSRIYACRELATSRPLQSVRDTLAYQLRQLLPEDDKRLPTPVEFEPEPWGGRNDRW
jgi:hypothetical protein